MPPKGKGKGKSKKRKEPLTEEQKIKQAEQKALAEREKLIRRKRLTTAFLKVKKCYIAIATVMDRLFCSLLHKKYTSRFMSS